MLRTTLRLAEKSAPTAVATKSAVQVPGLEYTACRTFAGEFPTHRIPAKDDAGSKNAGLWTGQPFQINYGPNRGRFDYGTVEHGYNRGLIKIFIQETHWTVRQIRYIVYMGLWMVPMALYLNLQYQLEDEGKKRGN